MVINVRNFIVVLTVMLGILFIPSTDMVNAHAKTQNNPIHYTIKKGDTFYLLGLRFNSSIKEISELNPKLDPRNLMIGSKLKIPFGSGINIHHVKRGDTLGTIAANYNSTVNLIATKNYIQNPNIIYPGDILAVPEISEELVQIAGEWISTGTTEHRSTEMNISRTGSDTFNISFYTWAVNAFGSYQERYMDGTGRINNGKLEFTIEPSQPNANLKGTLMRKNEKLLVEFIGDLLQYQGPSVGFETEFVRKRP